MNNICYIVGAGDNTGTNFTKKENDYVIAVDGGYKIVKKLGISPDLTLGDFDSLGYVPDELNIKTFQVEKDYTDTMIAVMEAIKLGYTDIRIYGGTGGRADHTFANIQTLLYGAKKGADMRMVDRDRVYNVINDSKIILKNRICVNLSIFALGDKAEGVSILGAKYELKDGTLTNDYPLAVSNTFVGNDVSVEVKKGALLIIYDR